MILGFSGYLLIGLIVGIAYPQRKSRLDPGYHFLDHARFLTCFNCMPTVSQPSRVGIFIFLYGLLGSFGTSPSHVGYRHYLQVSGSRRSYRLTGNLGPGNTLGLTSAESYATSVRGTCCESSVQYFLYLLYVPIAESLICCFRRAKRSYR